MTADKITFVMVVKDRQKAGVFWDAHRDGKEIHGCEVQTIATGDRVQDLEDLEGKYHYIIDSMNCMEDDLLEGYDED